MNYIYYGIFSSPYVNEGEKYLSTNPAESLDELYKRCGTDETLEDYIGFDKDDLVDCKRAFNQCREFMCDDLLVHMDFGNLDVDAVLNE